MVAETWRVIPDFPNYEISDLGNIYNVRQNRLMRTSINNFGHVKITLMDDTTKRRYTRSVAQMVAEAFVEPPNVLCDTIVALDGDLTNVAAQNLVWRPRWFQWKYARQMRSPQPIQYKNLPVLNITTGDRYSSIVSAGTIEGLLFDDVWHSTYTKLPIFPYGGVFEIQNRV